MTQGCENVVATDFEKCEWDPLTFEEKNQLLFLREKQLLDMFLERNDISKAQYKSLFSIFTLLIKRYNIKKNR